MQRDGHHTTAAELITKTVLLACTALAAITLAPHAAAKPGDNQDTTTRSAQPLKKAPPTKVKAYKSSSEETEAERSRRLYRECKGMNNAGACKGYTRK